MSGVAFNKNFAISDLHFCDRGITCWERTNFASQEEHDEFILDNLRQWAMKAPNDCTLWNLGDFGNVHMLEAYKEALTIPGKDIRLHFICGNHESAKDIPLLEKYFDKVYEYPVYLSQKLILSHEPVWPLAEFCCNICGHLHNATLDSDNHVCVSAKLVNYKPYKFTSLNKVFAKLPDRNMRFLWESYADQYKILNDRNDLVYDPITRKIDLAASRALQKSMRDENWNLLK